MRKFLLALVLVLGVAASTPAHAHRRGGYIVPVIPVYPIYPVYPVYPVRPCYYRTVPVTQAVYTIYGIQYVTTYVNQLVCY